MECHSNRLDPIHGKCTECGENDPEDGHECCSRCRGLSDPEGRIAAAWVAFWEAYGSCYDDQLLVAAIELGDAYKAMVTLPDRADQ